MRIVFATTLRPQGSTVTGRVLPLARELTRHGNQVRILTMHGPVTTPAPEVSWQTIGTEPFTRSPAGKKRLRGIRLVLNMLQSTIRTSWALVQFKPDVVIIVKPLPANVLAAYIYHFIQGPKRIVLDADDFELTANVVTSFTQRIAIQWSHRVGAHLADHIVVATPFLQDHFTNLVNGKKVVSLIVTGHTISPTPPTPPPSPTILYMGSVSVTSGHRIDLLPTILQKVLQVVPAARLIVAGDGDDITQLKDSFHQLNIDSHVTWHGRFQVDDVEGLVHNGSVLIDPIDASVTARAKSSFRSMLSLAFGVPLVTSSVGVRSLLIPPQFHDRFFATPADASSYANKIIEHFQRPLTPAEQSALQQAAATYTWAHLAKQYNAILKKV